MASVKHQKVSSVADGSDANKVRPSDWNAEHSVSVDHADLGSVTSDQHHAQSHAHNGGDGSGTVAHGDLTGTASGDHHGDNGHHGTIAAGLVSARPAAGTAGRLFWATDENILYRDNGSSWDKAAVADHADLDGKGTDDHHAESHNVASHSDTTATGAELEELTDGSETTLHSHAGGGATTAYKASDETVNNSSTLQNDDDLSFSIAANEVFGFECWLVVETGATPDFKAAFTVPTGATVKWAYHPETGTGGSLQNSRVVVGSGSSRGYGSNNFANGDPILIKGFVINGANAGTVQLQWAQSSADMSDTVVKAGSYLVAHKLN